MANDSTEAVHAGLLERIKVYNSSKGRCPRPFELCEEPTQFTAIVKALEALERAGALVRDNPTTWERYNLASSGTSAPRSRSSRTDRPRRISLPEGQFPRGGRMVNGVHLYPDDMRLLQQIAAWVADHGTFPGPSDIGKATLVRLTDQARGHLVARYRRLKEAGLLIMGAGHAWKLGGAVTAAGHAFLSALPEVITRNAPAPSVRRIGGGLAADGGTRFPHMLRPASEGVLKFPTSLSKLGDRVTKTIAGGPAQGRRIATYSLEEGRTCSPACGLIAVCFAGKMFRERRIKYEGPETDKAIADAIEAGSFHWRLHTVGDFPNEAYLNRVVAALLKSGSTAWGYTHWTMADRLGAAIARQAKEHWGTFSVRLSYEAWGVRPPAHVPAAVVVREFTPEVLKEHNAVPCPEQVQDEGLGHLNKPQINCAKCGLCWTALHKTIAFKLH